jgi:ketosteroid isomerase-like protein
MEPRELVQAWVEAFNRADVAALAALYSEDGTNHQVAERPVVGRPAIREMFANERGYWDKLSFLRMHGLPVPPSS